MKPRLRLLFITLALVTSAALISCDSINKLPLNVPISFEFQLAGAGLTDTKTFCMSESESYLDYQGDIQKLTLLRIIYRTDGSDNSVIPETLEGTFELVIRRLDTNELLLSKVVQNFKPIEYKKPNKPYELELTATDFATVNEYLNSNKDNDPCFQGTVRLLDVSGATQSNYLFGHVDVLIEAEIEL